MLSKTKRIRFTKIMMFRSIDLNNASHGYVRILTIECVTRYFTKYHKMIQINHHHLLSWFFSSCRRLACNRATFALRMRRRFWNFSMRLQRLHGFWFVGPSAPHLPCSGLLLLQLFGGKTLGIV